MSGTETPRGVASWIFPIALGTAIGMLALGVILIVRSREPSIVIADTDNETLQVWIEGAVERPGLYALEPPSTVGDLLKLAGGPKAGADTSQLDLDLVLTDGFQVQVPGGDSAATSEGGSAGPIDINRAPAAELEALPGIGPVLSNRIVQYRDEHGPFATIDDLAAVRGISPRMVEDLRDLVVVGQ